MAKKGDLPPIPPFRHAGETSRWPFSRLHRPFCPNSEGDKPPGQHGDLTWSTPIEYCCRGDPEFYVTVGDPGGGKRFERIKDFQIPREVTRLIEDPKSFYQFYVGSGRFRLPEHPWSLEMDPAAHAGIIAAAAGGRPVDPSRRVTYCQEFRIWLSETDWRPLTAETPDDLLAAPAE